MHNILAHTSWSPYAVGVGIGVLSWFAFATADHPIGVTSAFEKTAAVTVKSLQPPAELTNEYFSEKAAQGQAPKIGWEAMLVLGVLIGAALSAKMSGDQTRMTVPELWKWRFGSSVVKRFVAAFAAGALMMFGARLAQGCTSGHGISGSLQLAISSWVFVVIIFATGTAVSFLMFGKEGAQRV